jgi:hypothetical protein
LHVKLGPESGHGEDFVAEFKRVLDANKWEVMDALTLPLKNVLRRRLYNCARMEAGIANHVSTVEELGGHVASKGANLA